MAAGKKRVMSNKVSIRRITSTEYGLAKKNGVLSEQSGKIMRRQNSGEYQY